MKIWLRSAIVLNILVWTMVLDSTDFPFYFMHSPSSTALHSNLNVHVTITLPSESSESASDTSVVIEHSIFSSSKHQEKPLLIAMTPATQKWTSTTSSWTDWLRSLFASDESRSTVTSQSRPSLHNHKHAENDVFQADLSQYSIPIESLHDDYYMNISQSNNNETTLPMLTTTEDSLQPKLEHLYEQISRLNNAKQLDKTNIAVSLYSDSLEKNEEKGRRNLVFNFGARGRFNNLSCVVELPTYNLILPHQIGNPLHDQQRTSIELSAPAYPEELDETRYFDVVLALGNTPSDQHLSLLAHLKQNFRVASFLTSIGEVATNFNSARVALVPLNIDANNNEHLNTLLIEQMLARGKAVLAEEGADAALNDYYRTIAGVTFYPAGDVQVLNQAILSLSLNHSLRQSSAQMGYSAIVDKVVDYPHELHYAVENLEC